MLYLDHLPQNYFYPQYQIFNLSPYFLHLINQNNPLYFPWILNYLIKYFIFLKHE